MKLLRMIVAEIVGLFVDDSGIAPLAAGLIALVALAVRFLALPALLGGVLLLLGCLAILAATVLRRR